MLHSISAVLPSYNEEGVIAETIRRTAKALAQSSLSDFEVLVVNDGSTDHTAEIADSLTEECHVRVLNHSSNRGYGAALATGFNEARMQASWLMDSDGQFDPKDLGLMTAHYSEQALVAGYRAHRHDSAARRLFHFAFFLLVRVLFGPVTRDVNCAFKLFPAVVGRNLASEGAVVSTELVLRARRAGYEIVEVAVPHYPRRTGQATGAKFAVVIRAFVELFNLRRNSKVLDALPRVLES